MASTMTNGELRRARRMAELTQAEVARELGIARQSYLYFERWGVPLPGGRTPSDALDAIERLAAQKRDS